MYAVPKLVFGLTPHPYVSGTVATTVMAMWFSQQVDMHSANLDEIAGTVSSEPKGIDAAIFTDGNNWADSGRSLQTLR